MTLPSVEVVELTQTRESAETLVAAATADMERGYEHAVEVAELRGVPLSPDYKDIIQHHLAAVTVDRTYGRLGKFPGQYFAAQIEGEDVAFARLNRWGALDQAPYETGATKRGLELFGRIPVLSKLTPLFGIHGMYPAVSDHSVMEQERGYTALVEQAKALAKGREIRINVQDNDLVTDVLLENDFEATGRYTTGITHALEMPQQLFTLKNYR